MNQLVTYFTFNGNCREAMTFYHECLGGELHFQTVGDSPGAEGLPEKMKGYILQATLKTGNTLLMATDMVEGHGLQKGNDVSLLVQCNSEDELKSFYRKLLTGGVATQPVEATYWGTLFGGLSDKYGKHWLLSYSGK